MYADTKNYNRRDTMRKAERTEKLVTTAVILTAATAGGIGIALFTWQAMEPLLAVLGGGL